MYSVLDDQVVLAGFPHSDIYGSKLVCQLPVAFRRLPRLSSPPAAKASTVCTYSLDHITQTDAWVNARIDTKREYVFRIIR